MDSDDLYSDEVETQQVYVDGLLQKDRVTLFALPEETLEDIIPKLSTVTGLPVVGPTGKVVGVISRKVSRQSRRGVEAG